MESLKRGLSVAAGYRTYFKSCNCPLYLVAMAIQMASECKIHWVWKGLISMTTVKTGYFSLKKNVHKF